MHAGAQDNPALRTFQNLLCKFNAELSEVFPCGSQVVTDDGDILLNVKNDRGDVGALVTDVLHILPLHLKTETGQDKALDGPREDGFPVGAAGAGAGVEARPGLALPAAALSWGVCLSPIGADCEEKPTFPDSGGGDSGVSCCPVPLTLERAFPPPLSTVFQRKPRLAGELDHTLPPAVPAEGTVGGQGGTSASARTGPRET